MRRMVFILVALNIVSSVLFAKTWVVDTTGYEGDSLQIAVDSAWQDPGIDTVLVKDGTYHLAINGDTGLIMHDSVVLISENGALKCTLTAISEDATDTAYHVIYCSDWDTASHAALIKGFTIMNGNARSYSFPHYHGGGIFISHASPKINSCIITNNSAKTYGGGIYICYYSSPSLTNNTISNNSADYGNGGGIYIYDHSSPSLTNNTISNNSADHGSGGGIYICYYSSPSLANNTISNNSAYDGGGIYIKDHSSPSLANNTISNNSAYHGDGGGIYICHSSPSLANNTISNNSTYSYGDGGGIYIYHSSPSLTNNTISNNSTYYYGNGGGIYICHSSPSLANNTILNNSAHYRDGGGIYICYYSSPSLTNNTISNNSADYGRGGGIYIYYHSSPSLTNNTISNNSALHGGGIYIRYHSSPSLTHDIISSNPAYYGGGIYICCYSSVELVKCVMGMNKSYYTGGAIYDTLCSKVIIDSSFIVDNGDRVNHQSGLAYITSDADSGVTFRIAQSHIYYNTFQSDTEIYNLSSVTIPVENNFWWDTTDAEISSKIYGPNDHEPWVNDFIGCVPGEPVSIDSIRNYDKDFATVVDSIGGEDTLYIRVYGQDRNNHIREIAVVIIKSSVYPEGIACGLVETDTNSGIYQGVAYVRESTGNDTIRVDDIEQTIRVNSSGDGISLIGNIDTTKKFHIKYKGGPQPDIALQDTVHDFGYCSPTDTVDWQLYVKNVGSVDLMIDSVRLDLPFALVSPSLPDTIPPADSTAFTIRFNPTDTGSFCDTMGIFSSDPDEPVVEVKLIALSVGIQEVLPKVFTASVSPNLFRDFTVIKYQMPQKERVILKILDITGRVVNTLVDEIKEPGYYSVVWRGKDTNGRDLPSGIYFYAIEAGKNRVFGKIIRLK